MASARRAAELFGLALIGCALVFLLTTNLGRLPGLHGDEAWFGTRAREILEGRSSSIHGMNGYTGAVFPYLVSLSFRAFGVSVTSLRGIGALLNLATIALLVATAVASGRGRRGVFTLLVIVACSLLMTSEARVAWEVTALNPFLAAALLCTSAVWLRDAASWSRLGVAAACLTLFILTAVGVYSHFIFLAFALALFAAALACCVRYPSARSAQLLVATAVAMANLALLVAVKLLAFRANVALPYVGLVFLGLVLGEAAALARLSSSPEFLPAVQRVLRRRAKLVRACLLVFFCAGTLAFLACHAFAFVQAISNDVVLKRMYSVAMPTSLAVASYSFGVLLLALYLRALYGAVRGRLELTAGEYLLLVMPAATAAALPLLVRSNSIRYYILCNVTLLMGAWVSHRLATLRARRATTGGLVAYAVALNVAVVTVVRDPRHYDDVTPMRFVLGYGVETSAHFLASDAIFERMRADRVAALRTTETFFINGPMKFYGSIQPWEPTPGRTAIVDYDYDRAGGIAYSLEDAEPARAP